MRAPDAFITIDRVFTTINFPRATFIPMVVLDCYRNKKSKSKDATLWLLGEQPPVSFAAPHTRDKIHVVCKTNLSGTDLDREATRRVKYREVFHQKTTRFSCAQRRCIKHRWRRLYTRPPRHSWHRRSQCSRL